MYTNQKYLRGSRFQNCWSNFNDSCVALMSPKRTKPVCSWKWLKVKYIELKIIKIYKISRAVCNDLICQIGFLCPTTWNDIFHSNLSSRISTSNSKYFILGKLLGKNYFQKEPRGIPCIFCTWVTYILNQEIRFCKNTN